MEESRSLVGITWPLWDNLRVFPTICSATLGGYYNEGDKSNSYHLYIARTTYMGEMVPVRQVHAGHHYAVVFARGTNNFITAVSALPVSTACFTD